MTKTQLLSKIEQAWAALQASYAGLTEAQLTEPGAAGDWSVKEILAHVTVWEEEALKYLPLILGGGRPPRYSVMYGGIDAFNAQMTEQKGRLPLAEILAQLAETHRRLVAYVGSAPDEQFTTDTRFRRRVRLDTYGHYPVHTEAIRAWRARLS